MTVKEYFELIGYDENCYKQVFFVQAKCYHADGVVKEFRYRSTPIRTVAEWWEFHNDEERKAWGCPSCLDDIVINTKAYSHDWMSGALWNTQVELGNYHGLLTISTKELEKYYRKKEAESIIKYIDEQIRKAIEMKCE